MSSIPVLRLPDGQRSRTENTSSPDDCQMAGPRRCVTARDQGPSAHERRLGYRRAGSTCRRRRLRPLCETDAVFQMQARESVSGALRAADQEGPSNDQPSGPIFEIPGLAEIFVDLRPGECYSLIQARGWGWCARRRLGWMSTLCPRASARKCDSPAALSGGPVRSSLGRTPWIMPSPARAVNAPQRDRPPDGGGSLCLHVLMPVSPCACPGSPAWRSPFS